MQVFEQTDRPGEETLTPATFIEALLRHEAKQPQAIFYTALHAGKPAETLTYAELCRAGRRLGSFCATRGINAGSIVLIILPHSGDLFRALFGSIFTGLIPSVLAVPSFKLNREVYVEDMTALCRRIQPAAILTTAEIHDELQPALQGVDCLVATWPEVESCTAPDAEPPQVSPDDLLLLQHSSGSTGLKKGVALSHRAILAQVEDYWQSLKLNSGDRIATWLPLYHDMGMIAATLAPLVTGTPVVGLSPFEWVAKPVLLLRAITEHRTTLCWLPNFAYNFMARRIRDAELEGIDLASMRAFVNCSEPVIAQSHRLFAERFLSYGLRPGALHTCYALAECTFAATQSKPDTGPRIEHVERDAFITRLTANPATADESSFELMSSGRPLAQCEVQIVDDQRNPLPDCQVGEIALRSRYLFDGYFQLPEETERVLVAGWYYSGDLGFLSEGELFVTGRKKDLIIIGGKNFYPQDIERIVSADEDVISGRVVALGNFDPELGTEELIVLAESNLDEEELRQAVGQRLRRSLTSQLDCVVSDLRLLPHMWLLKTSSGKIARRPNLERYSKLLK